MNPDLQKQLAEMLAKLMDATQNATAWSEHQIPLLVQEKLMFGRIWETASFAFLLLAGALGIKCVRVCARHFNEDVGDDTLPVIGGACAGVAALFCIVMAAVQLQHVFMVWFTPRLYIVEWLRGMVSK